MMKGNLKALIKNGFSFFNALGILIVFVYGAHGFLNIERELTLGNISIRELSMYAIILILILLGCVTSTMSLTLNKKIKEFTISRALFLIVLPHAALLGIYGQHLISVNNASNFIYFLIVFSLFVLTQVYSKTIIQLCIKHEVHSFIKKVKTRYMGVRKSKRESDAI